MSTASSYPRMDLPPYFDEDGGSLSWRSRIAKTIVLAVAELQAARRRDCFQCRIPFGAGRVFVTAEAHSSEGASVVTDPVELSWFILKGQEPRSNPLTALHPLAGRYEYKQHIDSHVHRQAG